MCVSVCPMRKADSWESISKSHTLAGWLRLTLFIALANPKLSWIINRFGSLERNFFHEELALKADFSCQVSWEIHFFSSSHYHYLWLIPGIEGKAFLWVWVNMWGSWWKYLGVSKCCHLSKLPIALLSLIFNDPNSGLHSEAGKEVTHESSLLIGDRAT